MKKSLFPAALALALALTLVLISGALAAGTDAYVTAETATQAALTHAGVAEADARIVRVKLDRDDGRIQYEIEFFVGNMEYDYDVDALTGAVTGFDSELESRMSPAAPPEGMLTGEQAQAAALEHAGLSEADVTLALNQLDYDDGQWVYDVEFYRDNVEYDYEIHAQTGAVLSFDQDMENSLKPAAPAGGDIGMDQARQIALTRAGVAEADAKKLKVEKDRDDGYTVYEVEFKVGGMEYEVKIDAATGDILKFEMDDD